MESSREIEADRRDLAALRARIGKIQWFHNWELLPGVWTGGWHAMSEMLPTPHIPHDLSGKRVLDVGCADGYYSFLAESRGAEVVSIDVSPSQGYTLAHDVLGSRATFHHMSLYDVRPETLGTFDVVFCFGVYYHLKHPLLGMERIAGVTRDYALVESAVADLALPPGVAVSRFFEFAELNDDPTNWWAPNVEGLVQTMRAAGFPRAALVGHDAAGSRAIVRAEKGPRTAGKALGEDISLIIDSPRDGEAVSGMVDISGWTLHHLDPEQGVARVSVYLDRPDDPACALGEAEYPLPREDLAPRVNPIYGDVGFRLAWDSAGATPGPHRLYVLVEGPTEWQLGMVPVHVGQVPARQGAAAGEVAALHQELAARDAEIARLRALVDGYERGRFIRLMKAVRGLGRRR
ncbi:MAG: class I SAM-dependent methyltransferase [Anaerolineae bacterium]